MEGSSNRRRCSDATLVAGSRPKKRWSGRTSRYARSSPITACHGAAEVSRSCHSRLYTAPLSSLPKPGLRPSEMLTAAARVAGLEAPRKLKLAPPGTTAQFLQASISALHALTSFHLFAGQASAGTFCLKLACALYCHRTLRASFLNVLTSTVVRLASCSSGRPARSSRARSS